MLHQLLRRAGQYDPFSLHNPPPPVYPQPSKIAFFALNVVGAVLCGMLLLTLIVSRNIKRDKSVYNFFAVMLLVPVVKCLLLGRADNWPGGNVPSFGACLLQSSMILGLSTIQAASGIGLVFKVWLTATNLQTNTFARWDHPAIDWFFIALPWLIWVAYIIANVVVGLQFPGSIRPDGWYCASRDKGLVDAHHYTSAAFAVLIILQEIALGKAVWGLYYKRLQLRRRMRADADARATDSLGIAMNGDLGAQPATTSWGGFSMPFAFRTLAFGSYTLVMTAITIWLVVDPKSNNSFWPDILNASISPAAGIAFGTLRDVMDAWRSIPSTVRSWWRRGHAACTPRSDDVPSMDHSKADADGSEPGHATLGSPPKTPMDERDEFVMSFEDFLGISETTVLDYDAPRVGSFGLNRRGTVTQDALHLPPFKKSQPGDEV